jgi:hypothetical protein
MQSYKSTLSTNCIRGVDATENSVIIIKDAVLDDGHQLF